MKPIGIILILSLCACSCLALTSATAALIYTSNTNNTNNISSYDDCVKAGYPVLESYPSQCSANGKTFTNPNEQLPLLPQPQSQNYYGSSSYTACQTNKDCMTMGCNSEICGGKNDANGMSVCIVPNQPLPQDLGYSCGCVQNQCAWNK